MSIAVNVSAGEFRSNDFVASVSATLSECGLDPHYLELELSEGVLMDDAEFTAALLKDLKAMGVHLAVDDFGSGSSSLSYLRKFPIDVLKIDRSFVKQITADSDDWTIVAAITTRGRVLNTLWLPKVSRHRNKEHTYKAAAAKKGKATCLASPYPLRNLPRSFRTV